MHTTSAMDVVDAESSGTHSKGNGNVRATFTLGGAGPQLTGVFSLLSPSIRRPTVGVDTDTDTSRRSSTDCSDSSTESNMEEGSAEIPSIETKIARPPTALKPSVKPSASPARKLSLPKAVTDIYRKVIGSGSRGGSVSGPGTLTVGFGLDHDSNSSSSSGSGEVSMPGPSPESLPSLPKSASFHTERLSADPKSPTADGSVRNDSPAALPEGSSKPSPNPTSTVLQGVSPRVLRAALIPSKSTAHNTCTDVAEGKARVEHSESCSAPVNTGEFTSSVLAMEVTNIDSTANKNIESGLGACQDTQAETLCRLPAYADAVIVI